MPSQTATPFQQSATMARKALTQAFDVASPDRALTPVVVASPDLASPDLSAPHWPGGRELQGPFTKDRSLPRHTRITGSMQEGDVLKKLKK